MSELNSDLRKKARNCLEYIH